DSDANTARWSALRIRLHANRPSFETVPSLSHRGRASRHSWLQYLAIVLLRDVELVMTSDTLRVSALAASGVRRFPRCDCKCPARHRARSECTNLGRDNPARALRQRLKLPFRESLYSCTRNGWRRPP